MFNRNITEIKSSFKMYVVKKGTGSKLYSKDFSMAGKTGTAQVDYGKDGGSGQYYASSLWGTFRQIT
jgi:cell division protein FtsI/penicillin-binding protein 2